MAIYKYLIPGYYLFHSRLKRKSEMASWLYINPFFLFVISILVAGLPIMKVLIVFPVIYAIWLSVYETGYLENDIQTTKNEDNPTLRISEKESKIIDNNYSLIFFLKILLSVLATLVLFFLFRNDFSKTAWLVFGSLVIMIRFFFFLHNKIRSKWNIITYFFLSSLKYLTIPIFFWIGHESIEFWVLVLGLLLSFPILRTLEHATKIKYGQNWLTNIMGNRDVFRVKYYVAFFAISAILFFFFQKYESLSIWIIMAFWFLLYRGVILIILRKTTFQRSESDSHKW